MNTSTQPPEGAGGSRSKAAGELTLGLMSGEERGVRRSCRSWLASEGGLPDDLVSRTYQSVGAAEGCDLLILFVSNNAKRSQPRCTRQLLQGNTHASEPGRPVGRLERCCGARPLERPRGGPTEQDRSEGMPSLGEAPNVRGKALWLLSRSSKVTRRNWMDSPTPRRQCAAVAV
jgi:hypothetical protein